MAMTTTDTKFVATGPASYGFEANGNFDTAAVYGTNTNDSCTGVSGNDTSTGGGYGVAGVSVNGTGVSGTTTSGTGVSGTTTSGTGVSGDSTSGYGVVGSSNGGTGVYGSDISTGDGVAAVSVNGTGVLATSKSGSGVRAVSSTGYGGEFQGGLAPLKLEPSSASGSPTTSTHSAGEFYVDNQGVLYFCTADGTPGTWKAVVLAT
jgi:hypothetical protein